MFFANNTTYYEYSFQYAMSLKNEKKKMKSFGASLPSLNQRADGDIRKNNFPVSIDKETKK